MKPNKELIIGAVVTLLSAYYWVAYGTQEGMRGIPLLFAFTYRLFPGAALIWTGLGGYYLVQGIRKARAEGSG